MNKTSKIFVAGHTGLAGSALMRKLQKSGYNNLVCRTHNEMDLRRQQKVEDFFRRVTPEYIFISAAKVGGILGNYNYPADFIYDNLIIQTNIIHSAYMTKVKKLLFLGSSCIYPKHCKQPMKEESLLSGYLEPTNEPYAVAKIAGIKTCQSYNRQYGTRFISVMPTNLYGPNDNFDLKTSHVLPALIRKFHEAKITGSKEVEIWGSGKPRREFLHVDDMADACLFIMENYEGNDIINIGTGKDLTIYELAYMIAKIVGFKANLKFDTSKPDGTLLKRLDVSRLKKMGWEAQIQLEHGIETTYEWFRTNASKILS